ncbi:starch-binding glucan 1,4-alpha-glucosidase [Dentipellis sp. KUC8613]|nr:starch-binding glucan 1,4-alpha-glucosidase [Dentipellis sp. KUC8613]
MRIDVLLTQYAASALRLLHLPVPTSIPSLNISSPFPSFPSLNSLLPINPSPNAAPGIANSVDAYIAWQAPIARCGVLDNIGGVLGGAKAQGALVRPSCIPAPYGSTNDPRRNGRTRTQAGAVIASPSSANPDYLYTWTRDAALVFKALSDELVLLLPYNRTHSSANTALQTRLDEYAALQRVLQATPNPSGGAHAEGLGEPKFHVDGRAYEGAWGRPQRDGPALRAIVLIRYANWLLNTSTADEEEGKAVKEKAERVWEVVREDLEYAAETWDQRSFDLWEEVASPSFFTTAVQHRALREGAAFARRVELQLQQDASLAERYEVQADNTLCFLQTYWNASAGHITANPRATTRSGIDANTVLAAIHTWDIAAGCDAATFQPCSDKALANLKVFVDAFRELYAVNRNASTVATGRYPEDVYDGTTWDGSSCEDCLGNPWYLTNFAVAEQLYDALLTWGAHGGLNVTHTSLPFFAQFAPDVAVGTYPASSRTYAQLTTAVRTHADAFLAANAAHTPENGGLAEQFSRVDGRPRSAFDLTWSYAAAGTAFAARAGRVTRAWGARGLNVPSVCVSGEGTVDVRFEVKAFTEVGESIYVVGDLGELGAWNAENAVKLSAERYPTWSAPEDGSAVTVDLPTNKAIQYKYIRIHDGQMEVVWEEEPAREVVTRMKGSNVRTDAWK